MYSICLCIVQEMNKEILTFGDIEIEKLKFHYSK